MTKTATLATARSVTIPVLRLGKTPEFIYKDFPASFDSVAKIQAAICEAEFSIESIGDAIAIEEERHTCMGSDGRSLSSLFSAKRATISKLRILQHSLRSYQKSQGINVDAGFSQELKQLRAELNATKGQLAKLANLVEGLQRSVKAKTEREKNARIAVYTRIDVVRNLIVRHLWDSLKRGQYVPPEVFNGQDWPEETIKKDPFWGTDLDEHDLARRKLAGERG